VAQFGGWYKKKKKGGSILEGRKKRKGEIVSMRGLCDFTVRLAYECGLLRQKGKTS